MNKPANHPPMMTIPVGEAAGAVLCHDITRIVAGVTKERAYKKGHVVTAEDIPRLLDLGKENLYVYSPEPGFVHEDEAARRLAAAAAGPNLSLGEPTEGKINFVSTRQGLLRIDVALLERLNSLGHIAFATLHSMRVVAAGEAVAGVRVVPLLVEERLLGQAEELCAAGSRPVVSVLPLRFARVGMIITGSEVFHGRIKDAFGPVLREKFAALGCSVVGERLTPDNAGMTTEAIHALVDAGADMIVLSGGMSVDPDDLTPAAILAAGATVLRYGAPVFPGAMFLMAHLPTPQGTVPVLGLPGCVMYHRATIFDLVVPRLLAGVEVTAEDIAGMGHGGFCAACPECHYPACAFGK